MDFLIFREDKLGVNLECEFEMQLDKLLKHESPLLQGNPGCAPPAGYCLDVTFEMVKGCDPISAPRCILRGFRVSTSVR